MVVGPTTLGLLQSCKNDPSYDWEPTFLSAPNGFALREILEVILPTTDTPGANDLNLAQFLDSYMNEVAPEGQREEFKKGAEAFSNVFRSEFDKETGEGTQEEYEVLVARYLRASPEEQEEYLRRTTETQDPLDKDPDEEIEFDSSSFAYVKNVRDMGIWAWKTSEEIGENVLWYDPVPGRYVPCGPVEELGNGKAMSL